MAITMGVVNKLTASVARLSVSRSVKVQPVAAKHIGKREVVGYGMNGETSCLDPVEFPSQAIRLRKESIDIQSLREKEKGDWKKLTIEEKKALYRASYKQTLAETYNPNGDWKPCTGVKFVALGIVMVLLYDRTVTWSEQPPAPSV